MQKHRVYSIHQTQPWKASSEGGEQQRKAEDKWTRGQHLLIRDPSAVQGKPKTPPAWAWSYQSIGPAMQGLRELELTWAQILK